MIVRSQTLDLEVSRTLDILVEADSAVMDDTFLRTVAKPCLAQSPLDAALPACHQILKHHAHSMDESTDPPTLKWSPGEQHALTVVALADICIDMLERLLPSNSQYRFGSLHKAKPILRSLTYLVSAFPENQAAIATCERAADITKQLRLHWSSWTLEEERSARICELCIDATVSRESAPDEEDRTRHQRRILETIRRLLFVIPISEPAVYCRLVGLLRSTEVTQEVRGKISMYIWHYDEHFHIGVAHIMILLETISDGCERMSISELLRMSTTALRNCMRLPTQERAGLRGEIRRALSALAVYFNSSTVEAFAAKITEARGWLTVQTLFNTCVPIAQWDADTFTPHVVEALARLALGCAQADHWFAEIQERVKTLREVIGITLPECLQSAQ
ncbi:predicted protein [Postia placenta Mad-698-R]|nr:predicted protein [Postia placenta Mad-698-R]